MRCINSEGGCGKVEGAPGVETDEGGGVTPEGVGDGVYEGTKDEEVFVEEGEDELGLFVGVLPVFEDEEDVGEYVGTLTPDDKENACCCNEIF